MPIQASTPQPRVTSSIEVNFKWLWITIIIVYIHLLNGYRDLNSYMKRLAINANGNTITSFARELNPTGVGEYISILSSTDEIHYNAVVCILSDVSQKVLRSFSLSTSDPFTFLTLSGLIMPQCAYHELAMPTSI